MVLFPGKYQLFTFFLVAPYDGGLPNYSPIPK
jgi:hypothetical protein